MNLQICDPMIPGTILKKSEMGDVTGAEFLKKIFYISEGVMLTQIREISGVDGSTLQNWTKRGWVGKTKRKKYDVNQTAHILIINMLRKCMQLESIDFLIKYINGRVDDPTDDIISDMELYDYICRIIDSLVTDGQEYQLGTLKDCIGRITADYEEKVSGARKRLNNALEIIIVSYYASLIKSYSDEKLSGLMRK